MMMGDQFYTSGPSKGQMHQNDLYHASSLGMTHTAPHHWQPGYFGANQGPAGYYHQ